MAKPSIILMGAKPGSVVALEILLRRGWNVRAVVFSEKSKAVWLPGPYLDQRAKAAGIQVFQKQADLPKVLQVDFVVSYMFRYLVTAETRALARRGALNFHAGPLPKYAGWAFYNLAILENATEYGCTCHYMDNGFDTGPILKVRRFPIDAAIETATSLERKAQIEMLKLFREFCELAEAQEVLPQQPQNPKTIRYLTQADFDALKQIPATADSDTVQRYARAFWFPPYDCAFVKMGTNKVQVVPDIVKEGLAKLTHSGDLEELRRAAQLDD